MRRRLPWWLLSIYSKYVWARAMSYSLNFYLICLLLRLILICNFKRRSVWFLNYYLGLITPICLPFHTRIDIWCTRISLSIKSCLFLEWFHNWLFPWSCLNIHILWYSSFALFWCAYIMRISLILIGWICLIILISLMINYLGFCIRIEFSILYLCIWFILILQYRVNKLSTLKWCTIFDLILTNCIFAFKINWRIFNFWYILLRSLRFI